MLLRTIFEVLAAALLIYGFYKEDTVIAFEQRMKRKICRAVHRVILKYEKKKEEKI